MERMEEEQENKKCCVSHSQPGGKSEVSQAELCTVVDWDVSVEGKEQWE